MRGRRAQELGFLKIWDTPKAKFGVSYFETFSHGFSVPDLWHAGGSRSTRFVRLVTQEFEAIVVVMREHAGGWVHPIRESLVIFLDFSDDVTAATYVFSLAWTLHHFQ